MVPYFRMLYGKRSTAYYLFGNWPEKIEITQKRIIYTQNTKRHYWKPFFSKRISRIISEQKREQEARALRHVDNRENCSSWQELQD
jgi:hypothetical protein